jgi:hypothetical protein
MKDVSIYHLEHLGGTRTIRFNLAAIRRLLPEYQIDNFNLTSQQRNKMQRRVDLYVGLGGKCDFQTGIDASEERVIPARIIPAKDAKMVRGKLVPASKREVIPARIEPAKPEILPSINHLPNDDILDRALRLDFASKTKTLASV